MAPGRSCCPLGVTALGQGVQGFSVGDEILGPVAPGHGRFAEHTVVRAQAVVAKPEEISFADDATIPVAGSTAYDGRHQIELEAGKTLLILGIGVVGLMAAQIGKVHTFTVIGTGSESKRDGVESIGAAIACGENLAARIRQVLPVGVDLILDLVGGQALRDVADVIEYGLVDPHVSALYPLQCSGEAFAAVENGDATGKVVIEMSQA